MKQCHSKLPILFLVYGVPSFLPSLACFHLLSPSLANSFKFILQNEAQL